MLWVILKIFLPFVSTNSFLIDAAKCIFLRYSLEKMNSQQRLIRVSILEINPEFPDEEVLFFCG